MICDLVEFRKNIEGKDKIIIEIKMRLEEVLGRLDVVKNIVGNRG